MDIEAALSKARDALREYRNATNRDDPEPYRAVAAGAADDLVDAFEALDGWLSQGGFLPDAWLRAAPDEKLCPCVDGLPDPCPVIVNAATGICKGTKKGFMG